MDVQTTLTDRLGRVWLGTNNGLAVVQNGRVKKVALGGPLRGRRINALSEDRKGIVWIGTDHGLARLTGDKVTWLSSPEAISQGAILSFLQDRDGDMWIGTDSSGVTVLRDRLFKKFGHDYGVPEDLIRCVAADSAATLWVGTNGHGLRRFNGETFSSFTAAEGLSSDVILSLAGDPQGRLLAGTPDGLNIVYGKHVQRITSADGLPDDFVRSLYAESDGTVWIGTRAGLTQYSDGRMKNYTAADGLPSELVGEVVRSRNGCLWVGTLKGLACIKDNKVNRVPGLESLHERAITALHEDADGVLWIGTNSGGLSRLKGAQDVFQFPRNTGLPDMVSGILEDASDQLWISSPRGLYRASKRELNLYAERKIGTISLASYDAGDGLPVNEFSAGGHPAGWKDAEGRLWFASTKGLIAIDARHTAPHTVPPLVTLERAIADEHSFDPSAVSAFGPGLSRLSFEFTGISFVAPQHLRFKYRLEGFDRHWIDAGSRRDAYYTNLPPGSYQFLVMARNRDGIWSSQAASVSFRMRAHFYQTKWFFSLLLFIAAGMTYTLYRWRVNRVRAEFQAVIAERNRIAREIHDTLAQGFVGVSLQLELAQRLMSTSFESAREILQQTQVLVQESLEEARRAIWSLRSRPGSEDTLPSKLSKAIRQSVQNKALEVKFQVQGAYRPLPPKIEDEILRIGQEAVMNVVRHAQASHLQVSLVFNAKTAEMHVSDDGLGFEPESCESQADGHFGLRGMRERAEAINAKLSVVTATGSGTRIRLELPLP